VLAVAADLITNTPDRSNQGPVVSRIQLAAKIIDVTRSRRSLDEQDRE
jgi:hypothetical protein